MKNDSLSSLAIMAKGGDEDAICSIVGEFKVTVRQIARKYFLLGAEMEDLIQEGMIGLIKAINSFSEDKAASFNTYAYVCIKRSIYSAIKKYSRVKSKSLTESISLDGEGGIAFGNNNSEKENETLVFVLPSKDLPPDEGMILKEDLKEMEKAIMDVLSEFEKEVLNLFLEGRTYANIAENLGKKPASIENALSRIRAKLAPFKNR